MAAKPHFKRRIYIVNPKMQWSMVGTTVGVLLLLGVFFAAALYVLPDDKFFELMGGEQVRLFLTRLTGAYFIFCISCVFALTVILSNRIAGPAMVLEHAIRGMLEGDFGKRLSLRQRDYLKPLAATLKRLRDRLVDDRDRRLIITQELESALEMGDVERARELVRELSGLDASEQPTADIEVEEAPEDELVPA